MFRKITSTGLSDSKVSAALLILRVLAAIIMIPHGYGKLTHYSEIQEKFMDFMGLGKSVSLGLVIFAEFFCSILLAAGLFTRFALIPLVIAMLVAIFHAHNGEIFGDGEHAFLYLVIYMALLVAGPGRYSADHYIFNRGKS
jgi:putative oxidoreductase